MILSYIEIKSDMDIQKLMNEYGGFNDSCIKEMRYVSGGYVDEEGNMCPFDFKKNVYILFHSQGK